jgi:hypothetical protein
MSHQFYRRKLRTRDDVIKDVTAAGARMDRRAVTVTVRGCTFA